MIGVLHSRVIIHTATTSNLDHCIGSCTSLLYLLEGSDPSSTFQLLFAEGRGKEFRVCGPQLHLPRFLALRARLRLAFPRLASVSDAVLFGLLAHISGSSCSSTGAYEASTCAFIRLMPGHPERGCGQPTKAEQELFKVYEHGNGVPVALGDGDVEPADDLGKGWFKIRGLCVLSIRHPIDFSGVGKAIKLIDAFHRGA